MPSRLSLLPIKGDSTHIVSVGGTTGMPNSLANELGYADSNERSRVIPLGCPEIVQPIDFHLCITGQFTAPALLDLNSHSASCILFDKSIFLHMYSLPRIIGSLRFS